MQGFEIRHRRFAHYILGNAPLEELASGFRWLEGPVWMGDANCLLFQDLPRNRTMRWTEEGGVTVYRAPSDYANGQTRDRQGRLIACSHHGRCLYRTELDGRLTRLVTHHDSKRLNAPNDVVVKSDDTIWFTDPLYGIQNDYEGDRQTSEQPPALYRHDPARDEIRVMADDFDGPNGLVFSPDERRLYVAETGSQVQDAPRQYIRAFDLSADGRTLSGGEIFHKVEPGYCDRLKVDEDGNLWSSAGGGVHCISPQGELLGKILVLWQPAPGGARRRCGAGRMARRPTCAGLRRANLAKLAEHRARRRRVAATLPLNREQDMISGLHRRAKRLACAVLLTAPVAACSGGPLDPHGPVAAQQRLLIFNALAVMLAIVIPTIIAAVGFTYWFRASNPRAQHRPHFVYSGRVEIVTWAIPTLTVIFLGGLIWTGSYALDPYRRLPSDRPTTEVQVVALDWKWLFIYPEQGIASVNELVVPVGAPVHFSMTSASVMNTFSIPQLGGMIYVMNGMVTQLNLQADHPGDFYGRSAHFSGDGFSDMRFTARAVPEADFSRWVEATRGAGPTLDREAYATLTQQSVPERPFTYRAVDPDLFVAVATQRIPPAPGPSSGRGGPGIREKAEK